MEAVSGGYASLTFQEAAALLGLPEVSNPETLRIGLHNFGFIAVAYRARVDPVTGLNFVDMLESATQRRMVPVIDFGVLPGGLLEELRQSSQG